MNDRVEYAGLTLELPSGWSDITEDIEAGAPPTLARGADGVGVLQFTVGRYESGPVPDFTPSGLGAMLDEFSKSKRLVPLGEQREGAGRVRCVHGDFVDGQDFVRLYYISDGPNIGMISYRCDFDEWASGELEEADRLVASAAFLPPAAAQ